MRTPAREQPMSCEMRRVNNSRNWAESISPRSRRPQIRCSAMSSGMARFWLVGYLFDTARPCRFASASSLRGRCADEQGPRIAQMCDRAFFAQGPAREADVTAVQDEPVVGIDQI